MSWTIAVLHPSWFCSNRRHNIIAHSWRTTGSSHPLCDLQQVFYTTAIESIPFRVEDFAILVELCTPCSGDSTSSGSSSRSVSFIFQLSHLMTLHFVRSWFHHYSKAFETNMAKLGPNIANWCLIQSNCDSSQLDQSPFQAFSSMEYATEWYADKIQTVGAETWHALTSWPLMHTLFNKWL